MSTTSPCCHPDSNVSLSVRTRAVDLPSYAPDSAMRDGVFVTPRSAAIAAIAGLVAGLGWTLAHVLR